jgi:hypothetical protein
VEAWGGWFLFGLFAAILVWEEVWDLPQTAYLSSWLLLLITAGAVVCSAFFERRLWCRCVVTHMHEHMQAWAYSATTCSHHKRYHGQVSARYCSTAA